ncbi:uncharacterized protein L201_006335 [Kwoniella dendrophila CBS 6074]|uniref:UBX domain-containing protein 1 n=1 Tax=Kwoniella dendrophila CBS 6074 TaxID=1295534 RepID=A0AAX4K0Y6_9TREE
MPGLKPTQEDIDQFVAITQASPEDALHFLESGTTLEGAIEDFFATQTASEPLIPHQRDDDEEEADLALDSPIMAEDNNNNPPPAAAGGARTLGGSAAAEPLPAGWGQPERRRFGRLGESRDEDNEPQGGDDPEELYAGGGRSSGLAVQNPDGPQGTGNPLVDNILRMANQNGPRTPPAGASGAPKPASAFRGTGNTLGSDEAPSTQVPAPGSAPSASGSASSGPGVSAISPSMMDNLLASMFGQGAGGAGGAAGSAPPPGFADDDEEEDDDNDENVQTRRLTFWRNGFSIEDGPLLSYDDPQNKALLQAIESGRAPPSVFGVKFNQRLNVEVAQRRKEDYQAPPKKPAKPFGGSGNRLGSPAPEIASSSSSMPGGLPQGILVGGNSASGSSTPNTGASASGQAKFEVDESKPTTNIQLRLGDGTRMVAKVNLTHTIGDLRNYVSASRPDARNFVLQTTFPSKELSDSSETIEAAKLQNAVVVQRFT